MPVGANVVLRVGPDAPSDADLRRLVARAQNDRGAVAELRQIVGGNADFWRGVGDVAEIAISTWVNRVAGDRVLVVEALHERIKQMRRELGGPNPSPLERLLIDRIVVCWLQVWHADMLVGQYLGELDPEEAEVYQTRQDRCQRRYLAAIKMLALVRRLALPALQMTLANEHATMVLGQGSGERGMAAMAGGHEPRALRQAASPNDR